MKLSNDIFYVYETKLDIYYHNNNLFSFEIILSNRESVKLFKKQCSVGESNLDGDQSRHK